jgi:hypothetical protein
MERLNVYVCYRWTDVDEWRGACLVAAPDEEAAGRKVVDYEGSLDVTDAPATSEQYHEDCQWPERIVPLRGVYAEGETRILYDDFAR